MSSNSNFSISEPGANGAQNSSAMSDRGRNVTVLPATHTQTIPCLYSPAVGHQNRLAGTHCDYSQRDDQAELTWVADYIPG